MVRVTTKLIKHDIGFVLIVLNLNTIFGKCLDEFLFFQKLIARKIRR